MIFTSKKTVARRAALAICAVAVGGVVALPAQAQTLPALAPLPTTAISLQAEVTRVDGQTAELSSGWQQGLAVGMLLDLRDASGVVVGRIRLTEVMPQKSRGELVSSSGDVATARIAMAPYPLAITRIDGQTVNFALPAGNRALNVGDTLTIVRAGQAIGRARFTGYNPVAATVLSLTPGTKLGAGDVLWAYSDAGTVIAVTPPAAAAMPALPVAPAPTNGTAVPGTDVMSQTPAAASTREGATITKKDGNDAFANVGANEKDVPSLRQNKKHDYILAAAAAVYALTANPRQNSKRPLRDTQLQFSSVSALPGGGFGITPEGIVESGGAMQINIPVAYNPRKPTLLVGVYAQQNVQGDTITTAAGRNGTGLIGGGGKLGGRGVWLSRQILSSAGIPFGDSSYNVSVELAGETASRPAIAFGVQDIEGTYMRSPFVVATKRLEGAKPLYFTLGIGAGRFNGSRIFGGLSYSPVKKLSLAAEYDGVQANLGATFALGSRLFLLASYNDLFRSNKAQVNGVTLGRRYQVGATFRLF